jgi:membrane-bound ClpP family serine protease
MDGVTILNTLIVPNMILGIFAIASIIGLIIGIFIYLKDDEAFGSATAIASLVMLTVFGILFLSSEPKKQYEVTIDESVKFNEFMEHYRVIKQHGQIYVVEELDKSSCVLVEE